MTLLCFFFPPIFSAYFSVSIFSLTLSLPPLSVGLCLKMSLTLSDYCLSVHRIPNKSLLVSSFCFLPSATVCGFVCPNIFITLSKDCLCRCRCRRRRRCRCRRRRRRRRRRCRRRRC